MISNILPTFTSLITLPMLSSSWPKCVAHSPVAQGRRPNANPRSNSPSGQTPIGGLSFRWLVTSRKGGFRNVHAKYNSRYKMRQTSEMLSRTWSPRSRDLGLEASLACPWSSPRSWTWYLLSNIIFSHSGSFLRSYRSKVDNKMLLNLVRLKCNSMCDLSEYFHLVDHIESNCHSLSLFVDNSFVCVCVASFSLHSKSRNSCRPN